MWLNTNIIMVEFLYDVKTLKKIFMHFFWGTQLKNVNLWFLIVDFWSHLWLKNILPSFYINRLHCTNICEIFHLLHKFAANVSSKSCLLQSVHSAHISWFLVFWNDALLLSMYFNVTAPSINCWKTSQIGTFIHT